MKKSEQEQKKSAPRTVFQSPGPFGPPPGQGCFQLFRLSTWLCQQGCADNGDEEATQSLQSSPQSFTP